MFIQLQVKEDVVTTVKMKQSVETVVAMGTGSGTVCIFQLPSLLPGRVKQVCRDYLKLLWKIFS